MEKGTIYYKDTMISDLFLPLKSYKYLLLQLTQREIKARYKQSFIGYAWVLLSPLAQLIVFSFVFSIVFRFPTNNIPYVVFLYAGLLPWGMLQGSISSATQSLVDNAPLIRKVSFPREIIPYSVVLAKIVDFIMSSFIFIGLMFVYGVPFSVTVVMLLPLLLVQLILTTGLSLMLSSFNLFYRDILHLTNLLLMLWMYMTPIVYPLSLVPERYVWVYKLNPMVGLMEGYRSALFNYPFEWTIIGWSAGVSVILFIIGFVIFKRSERFFADVA